MEEKYIKKTEELHKKGVSLAGIVSILYASGLKGIRYMELRKYVKKECQRIDDRI